MELFIAFMAYFTIEITGVRRKDFAVRLRFYVAWLGRPAVVADLIEVVVTAERDSTIAAQFEVQAHHLDEPECFSPFSSLCATSSC